MVQAQVRCGLPTLRTSLIRWLGNLLGAGGFACLGWCAFVLIDAATFDWYGAHRLEMAVQRSVAGRIAGAARSEARQSGIIGRIELPRSGVSAIMAEGIMEATLQHAVGHMRGTAFPGERGNVVIAGHRETHFRGLRKVREGDRAVVTTPDGVFEYFVETIDIVKPDDLRLIQETEGPVLTLITCYPFGYVGRAPERFVVRARPVPSAS